VAPAETRAVRLGAFSHPTATPDARAHAPPDDGVLQGLEFPLVEAPSA